MANYYSDSDIVAFAASVGVTTTVGAVNTWMAANATSPIGDLDGLSEIDLKLRIIQILSDQDGSNDPDTITRSAQTIYEYLTSTSSSETGETIIRVPALNYTVDSANGLLQNIVYEHPSGGGGTFTLPLVDKLTLILSNQSTGALNFSPTVHYSSYSSTSGIPAGSVIKLVYSATDTKWYAFPVHVAGA